MRKTIILFAAMTGLLAAGGCGPARKSPPPPSPQPSAGHNAQDQRAAEKAVLTVDDVGHEYTAVPFTPSRQDDADDAKLSACLGQPPTKLSETARAFSKAFVTADKRQILSSVTFVSSAARARADLAALRAPSGAECVRRLLLDDLSRGPRPVKTLTVTTLEDVQSLGSEVCAYRFKTDVPPGDDEDLVQYVDLISAIKGRAEAQITFQDVNTPLAESYERAETVAMLGRLPAS